MTTRFATGNDPAMKRTTIDTRQLGYRFISILLGAILLAAAVFKGVDLDQFALQIRQYGILPDGSRLSFGVAWFMVVVEAVIGASLLMNWRPRAMLAAFIVLMLLFIGALIWAEAQGGVSDCGCFGPAAQRSPMEALLEDALLLLAAAFAWWLRTDTIYFKHTIKTWGICAVCVMAMILPLTMEKTNATQSAPVRESNGRGPGMILESTNGQQFDLGSGTILLALMSTDCIHCQESVPVLNEIVADAADALTVYAVAADDPAKIDRFVEENFAFYPVLPIDVERLGSWMGDDPLPQYLLFRDGRIVARWRDTVPEPQALIDLTKKENGA
jgi:thiol-disulfide isomerase/thioredoxin/uncharacterized membrane protein YphA (DoxX/SURF4 family)